MSPERSSDFASRPCVLAASQLGVPDPCPEGNIRSCVMCNGIQSPARPGFALFRAHRPEAELIPIRGRIRATRWPQGEPVTDESLGLKLAFWTWEPPKSFSVKLRLGFGSLHAYRARSNRFCPQARSRD